MKTTEIQVDALEVCDRTRVRKVRPNINSDVVEEYAEAYRCGLIVEPLDVFREKGTERYVVADGEHRLLALQRAKIKTVAVRMHDGDEVEALDFAIGCNHTHGVRRTKADRYHAFVRIMETPLREKYKTDTDLSEKIGVHKNTISNYKVQWRNSDDGNKSTQKKKQQARESAEQRTPKAQAPRQALNGHKQEIEAPAPEAETPAWTNVDEHGYALLKSAWRNATAAARRKFLEEYA